MPPENCHGLIGLQSIALALMVSLAVSPAAATEPGTGTDSRVVYSTASPDWLRAVGKLRVPGIKTLEGRRRHHLEDCSATLVSRATDTHADIIITAWHCLEFYSDLSQPIIFTLLPSSSEPISTEAYRLVDGGGMEADWAILRLYQPVPDHRVGSLGIHPGRANNGLHIAMAGYSSDLEKGPYGTPLTYDPRCSITGQSGRSSNSDCVARKGASGGAVVQVSERGDVWLSGVISQGDGNTLSTFVPVAGFRRAINRYLK
jgi:hypothetical protein